VGQMVFMHHVTHQVEVVPEERRTVDPRAYAA
jgi:hypothetical protein